MIRKAQAKFIITFMAVLLVVFLALYACIHGVIRKQNTAFIDSELNAAFGAYDENSANYFIDHKGLIVFDNGQLKYNTTIFEDDFAVELYDFATNPKLNAGHQGGLYFKFYNTSDGFEIFIASDETPNLMQMQKMSIDIMWPMLILYLGTLLCVWLLSFRIFQPIKDTFRKQKRFISDASHELKTPTTIIAANAEVLKEIHDSQWVDNIKSQTERLNGLIADMLALAKMDEEKPKLHKEKIEISETVTDIALSFDAVAFEQKKTLSLDIDENVKILGDVASLKKITVILLDNAVKHAADQGEIKVSLKSTAEYKATLSVFNTGSFIPDNQSDKVFERFYRGENSRNREYGGSGLGLSIAKNIADANKWKISAKSKLYESMEITIHF